MKTIILLILLLITNIIHSTEQIQDKIIYEWKEYNLNEYILQEYFEENPELEPNVEITSTDLWRGYIASCAVIENKLYLIDVVIDNPNHEALGRFVSIFAEIFKQNEPIFMSWFSNTYVFEVSRSKKDYHEVVIINGEISSITKIYTSKKGLLYKNRNVLNLKLVKNRYD